MSNSILIVPILMPLLTGLFLFLFRERIVLQRWISALSYLGLIGIVAYLVSLVQRNGVLTLNVGGWQPPFGIVLVVDMFSALLLLASSVVSFACLLYAFGSVGRERERFYFYPFFSILIAGVNGSFITGDLFNLFVFFEVMLLASYVLLSLGGTKVQLRESLKYVLINVVGSSFFLVAMGYLYAVIGTLNMAQLSMRVAEVGQDGLLTTISLLFLLVFGLKASLLLYYWLPGSYAAPPFAVSAIFAALLTKVGVYAIVRLFSLIFYHQPDITHTLIIWMSILTMLLGAIGAISHQDIRKILAYNVIVSIGFMMFGFAVSSASGLNGTLFYLLHDMIVKALIFIVGGAMMSVAKSNQLSKIGGLIRNHPLLGWLFLIAALGLAGIPPLSGFVGKVMIIQGGLQAGSYVFTGVALLTSLLVLYSVIKIFLNGFWGETLLSKDEEGQGRGALVPGCLLAALTIGLGLGGEGLLVLVHEAADVLRNPDIYIKAVFSSP